MSRKFEIKNKGEDKFREENYKYYKLIKDAYNRFDEKDYDASSMGCDYRFYNNLIKLILEQTPKFILEYGSGYTTYLMGHIIKDYKLDTKLLSLENEPKWYKWMKDENFDILNSIVLCDLKSWRDGESTFVKYIYDGYNADDVDFVLLDGPGHFYLDGETELVKNGINYNYYELIVDGPRYVLIDGRHDTQVFYRKIFNDMGYPNKYIKYG
jgi:hypothetical protein